jgi:Zn-dependent protease/CBS domain-containing protein
MSWSLKLFTIRGIPIRVHATFLLILVWAAYIGLGMRSGSAGWARGVAFMVAFTLLLFVCVVLHELGHSLVAQVFGVQVRDITLWPIGGVARIARMPERPYQEFLIAAAGPAVNIFLTFSLGAAALVWIGPPQLSQLMVSAMVGEPLALGLSGQALLLMLVVNNALLVFFNLIPALPMDGGRLLRSFLAAFMPFGRATRVASWLGQGIAVLMILAALLTGSFFLGLVAVFIFVGAWGERQQVISGARLQGLAVRQAMQPIGAQLHPLETLGEAAGRVAALPQAAYLVMDGGALTGVLSRSVLLAALRRGGSTARVAQYVDRTCVRLSPDDALAAADEQLAQAATPVAVITEGGQAVGLLSRADIARLAETLEAFPKALPRE